MGCVRVRVNSIYGKLKVQKRRTTNTKTRERKRRYLDFAPFHHEGFNQRPKRRFAEIAAFVLRGLQDEEEAKREWLTDR